jgi:hypothetical protein
MPPNARGLRHSPLKIRKARSKALTPIKSRCLFVSMDVAADKGAQVRLLHA